MGTRRGRGNGTFMNRMSVLIEEVPGACWRMRSDSTLIMNFPASRTTRNNSLLLAGYSGIELQIPVLGRQGQEDYKSEASISMYVSHLIYSIFCSSSLNGQINSTI